MGKILVSFMLLCLIESGKKEFSRFTVWHSFFKNEKSNLAHTQLAFWNGWRQMAVSKFLEQIFLFLDLFNLKFYLEVLYLKTIGEGKIKEKMEMDLSFVKIWYFLICFPYNFKKFHVFWSLFKRRLE